jgi:hypothetical protein
MQNLTVHLGSATPLSSRASPRVPALFTAPATGRPHLSVAPPPGTVLRPPCQLPLSPLCSAGSRAPRSGPCRASFASRGQTPRHPRGAWHPPTPGTPTFSLLFPSAALPPSRSLPARAAPLVPPSAHLSDSFSRAPEPPHRSSLPDRRRRPPAVPSPSRIPAEHRRRPPLLGELLPELPIPEISCKSLTPSPLPSCRTLSPPPATTGAPSPPMNAAA